ncbi:MAG: hypothetical protein M3342_13685 [Bacteroidota bacterium]|nr:hypothetical protein [Flavisolibacter sp.]MBD0352306.1 hypothetical protein [Flavisolibacter sp.]MBD0365531.1 hypothetical protein [Flavisolibacter sp.]MDQ3845047.1 hypothetical protein [Bacteroidota bacterium]
MKRKTKNTDPVKHDPELNQHGDPSDNNQSLSERKEEIEMNQSGLAKVNTGSTSDDRNNFEDDPHQDSTKGAGYM